MPEPPPVMRMVLVVIFIGMLYFVKSGKPIRLGGEADNDPIYTGSPGGSMAKDHLRELLIRF